MTNKQRYRQAFSVLHASRSSLMEVKRMKHPSFSRLAAICAAAALVIGLASVAYATDIGGIQRSIQFFLNGKQTDAVLSIEDGSYTLTWQDADGVSYERSGGGVAYDPGGRERPLTEAEIMEEQDSPEVEFRDDGAILLWYRETGYNITDRFDEDGLCHIQIDADDGPLYVTVDGLGALSCSAEGYIRVDLK